MWVTSKSGESIITLGSGLKNVAVVIFKVMGSQVVSDVRRVGLYKDPSAVSQMDTNPATGYDCKQDVKEILIMQQLKSK